MAVVKSGRRSQARTLRIRYTAQLGTPIAAMTCDDGDRPYSGGAAPCGTVQICTVRPGVAPVLVCSRAASMPLDLVKYVLAFSARWVAKRDGSFSSAAPESTAVLLGSC